MSGLWNSRRYLGTALHVAARIGNASAVKVILSNEGVDVTAHEPVYEQSPIHVAAYMGWYANNWRLW